MQMPARTPAMTAMTATTLDQLSGGRFLLGLGVSGPQVVEGWHGVPYGKPLVRTREYVEIVRQIWAREQPVEHQGEHYQIPYRGAGATGLGKPLKSILHGRQIPIYLASIGPKSVEQAAEIADGWMPIWYSPYRTHVYKDALDAGFKKAGNGKGLHNFDIAPAVTVIVGDDVQQLSAASSSRFSPSTSAAWGHAARTSTTTWPAATASKRGGEEDPGPLPRRQEGRGGRRGARSARRRGRAGRPEGAHPRPPRGVARGGVTTMICASMQIEALRALAEIGA